MIKTFFAFSKASKSVGFMVTAFFLTFLEAAANVVTSYLFGLFINTDSQDEQYLYIILISAATVVSSAVNAIVFSIWKIFERRLMKFVYNFSAETILHKDVSFFLNKNSSEISTKVVANAVSIEQTTQFLADFARNVFAIVASAVIFCIISWEIFLIFVGATVVMLSLFQVYTRRLQKYAPIKIGKHGEVGKYLAERVQNFKLVKLYSFPQKELSALQNLRAFLWFLSSLFLQGFFIALLLFYVFQSIGNLKKGSLVTLFVQSTTLFKSVIVLFSTLGEVAKLGSLLASIERLVERKATKALPQKDAKDIPGEAAVNKIEVQDVTFAHLNSEAKILKNVSVQVSTGQTIAFVGLSGSGKSTLSHIMMGFLKPSSGNVYINGMPLDRIDESWWHRQISWVSQDSLLFSGSIEDNLRFAKFDATVPEMMDALRKAEALSFVEELPEGIKTFIGEKGTMLSGGQKQRIQLAAMFLRNAPVIVLDEATSALDSKTEESLLQTLGGLQNKLKIVIAHRLKVIESVDNIYVMNKGCVVEEGTHAALMEKKGVYSSFVTALQMEELADIDERKRSFTL